LSATLDRIRALVAAGEVRVSQHAVQELDADAILLDDVLAGMANAVPVEDYAGASKGPSVLALQRDRDGKALHVVWGLARGTAGPTVLVTAYRPDPRRWSADFLTRTRR
jgi:Domain of unknown function (DUF4258)